MYVITDQLVRWDGKQPLKHFVNNRIMSLTKSRSQVLPDTFAKLEKKG